MNIWFTLPKGYLDYASFVDGGQYTRKTLYYLALKYLGFELAWLMLFQKHVVRTKYDIYGGFSIIKMVFKYDGYENNLILSPLQHKLFI